MMMLALLLLPAVALAVEVTPDFLSKDEVDNLLKANHNQFRIADKLFHGRSRLSNDVLRRLSSDNASCIDESTTFPVFLRTITETTPVHRDYFYDEDGETGEYELAGAVKDTVAFVFLTTNNMAEFVMNTTRIPAVAGTLVTFPGHVEHNTVITEGSVTLTSAFHVDSLRYVGPRPPGNGTCGERCFDDFDCNLTVFGDFDECMTCVNNTCVNETATDDPTPDPTPQPTPDPTPAPTPEPTPQPTPDPTPAPTPEPTPQPAPTKGGKDNIFPTSKAPKTGKAPKMPKS